jgi:hypothetical protein
LRASAKGVKGNQVNIDDTVWLENGLPGIVIGLGDGYITILWSNGSVTKVKKVYFNLAFG